MLRNLLAFWAAIAGLTLLLLSALDIAGYAGALVRFALAAG